MFELSAEAVNFDPFGENRESFFDNKNQKVCTVLGNGTLGITARGPLPQNLLKFRCSDKGKEFICVKLSPDSKIVAIQRTKTSVDFINLPLPGDATDKDLEYSGAIKFKQAKLYACEWIGNSEILFITDKGLEFYAISARKRTLSSLKTVNLPINWSVFCHKNSLLIVSSGTLGTTLNPFFVKDSTITRLPKFEADIGLLPSLAKLSLLDRDVCIANIYTSLYVLVLKHNSRTNSGAQVLVYEIQKEISLPAILVKRLEIGVTGRFAIHSLDNIIVVHHQTDKITSAFDIRLGNTNEEILLPFYRGQIGVPTEISTDIDASYEANVELYSQSWVVTSPDIIIDGRLGCMWKLNIKLEKAAKLIKDKKCLLKLLSGRRGAKVLLLDELKEAIVKKSINLLDLGQLFSMFAADLNRYHNSAKLGTAGTCDPPIPYGVIVDQSDLYSKVLHPIIDLQSDIIFLTETILQLLLATREAGIDVQPFLYELLVRCLIDCQQFNKLYQLIQHRVIDDSKALAFLLLGSETKYPPAAQLAIDMLQRIGTAFEEIIEILLAKRRVIEAMRYMEFLGLTEKINTLKFVEAAWETNDRHLQYTVFAHFVERSMRIQGTPHFARGDRYDRFLYDFKRLYPGEN